MKQRFTNYLCLAFICCATSLFAQPANNECANATPLSNLSNWCSANAAYSNAGATQSGVALPGCFPQNQTHRDIWFSFVAQANTLNMRVIGATSGNIPPGGTIQDPELAIYSGNCNNLVEVQCASDAFNLNVAETFAGPLTIGQTYYIRVAARDENTGTFKLCLNNYNAIPELSSDCSSAVILCDKSSFSVEQAVGEGNDPSEVEGTACIQQEIASSWYRWTCKESGTFTFTISPNNPADDIDFAVYKLPGGIDDCDNKELIRCEAAGENVGSPFSEWSVCTGATGLSLNESDISEAPGCAAGQNNFVAAIDMIAGESYALVINNFSESGNGFSIDFGGTSTFLGPIPAFTLAPNIVCQSTEITFTDASTSLDAITDWHWNFGVGASPATANSKGPHTVTYNTPGIVSVALTITNEDGCQVTSVENITVLPLPAVDPTLLADYCGPSANTGAVIISPTGDGQPYLYDWNGNGVFTTDTSVVDIVAGNYEVTVQTADGCTQTFNYDVLEGLSLAANVDPVNPPTCNGDSDGSISISIQIANPPVTFDFGNGPQSSNTLSGIPAGTYNVQVVDGQGCPGNFTIEVVDFPVLEPNISSVNISCFGENDGSAMVAPSGGAGNYAYLWSNGATTSSIENLLAGTYSVTVTDENGCSAIVSTTIIEPAELTMTLEAEDVICFGDETGIINVDAMGGTPPYEYTINGNDYQTSSDFTGLAAGDYDVVVKDSRGCTITLSATINEPPPIIVDAGNDQTIDLGYTVGINAVVTPVNLPVTLTWSPNTTLDCTDCLDPTALPFGTTTYLLTAIDENGCMGFDSVTIFVNLVRPVYFPNAFSPNGDGLNDYFTGYGGRAAKLIKQLKVFDRWGDNVYNGTDLPLSDGSRGWDGYFREKLMNPGVFAYLAQVEFIDGVVVLFEGDIMIVK
jgi:gliding motility-associated-like protein